MYVVFQKAETVKKKVAAGRGKKAKKKVVKRKKNAVLLYDNSGILRTEIPTNNSCGRNMEQIYGTLLVASGESQLSQINPLGQVIKTISLSGYRQAGEYTYDGSGNVYLIATAAGKKEAPASRVIEVVLETGGVTEMVNMNTLFKKVYQDAVKKSGKKNVNWVELNSVMVQGTNTLLLSSKKLSSIIKVSNVGSFLPKVNYIIADKRLYKKYDSLRKKVLTKLSEEEGRAL